MTIHYNKTQTWNTETPNNGTLLDSEFDQIYETIRDIAGIEHNPEEVTEDYSIIRHRGWGDKRQTILSGKTVTVVEHAKDNVKTAFLTAGSMANSVKLDCASDPLVIALSGGYDRWGAVEYTVTLQKSSGIEPTEWTNLIGDSKEFFLYIEIDPAANSISYGTSPYVPVYSHTPPSSTAYAANDILMTGQHWFDLNKFIMKVWNGTDWISESRIFIGEARCSAGGIDKLIPYALRGEYEFEWIDVENNTAYDLWHNIGTTNITCEVYVKDTITTNNLQQINGNYEECIRYCDYQYYYDYKGMGAAKRLQRNNAVIGVGETYVAFVVHNGDVTPSDHMHYNGQYKVRIKRTF